MEVCYKVFEKDVLDNIVLEENRFRFEPEFTVKIARLGCPIYVRRFLPWGTYEEGKKIT